MIYRDGKPYSNPEPNREEKQQVPSRKGPRRYGFVVLTSIGTLAIIVSGFAGHWMEWWVKLIIGASILSGSVALAEFLHDRGQRGWVSICSGLLCLFLVSGVAISIYYHVAQQTPLSIWQPQELPKDCHEIHVLVAEEIETNFAVSAFSHDTSQPVYFKGFNILQISITNNRVCVSAILPSYDANPKLTHVSTADDMNKTLPIRWDSNNSSAIEIVQLIGEEYKLPLLQVDLRRPDTVVIRGIFVTPELNIVVGCGPNGNAPVCSSPQFHIGWWT